MAETKTQDPDAAAKAAGANQAADEQAVKDAQAKAGAGKLVVLVRNFVARDSAKVESSVRQYRLGQEFHPLADVHDIEQLIRLKVIGRVGEGDTPLTRSTALDVAKAHADEYQEAEPVIDLDLQPFERPVTPDAEAAGLVAGPQGGEGGATPDATQGGDTGSQTGS